MKNAYNILNVDYKLTLIYLSTPLWPPKIIDYTDKTCAEQKLKKVKPGWEISDIPNKHVAAMSTSVIGIIFFWRVVFRSHYSNINRRIELHFAIKILMTRMKYMAPYLHIIKKEGNFRFCRVLRIVHNSAGPRMVATVQRLLGVPVLVYLKIVSKAS